MSRPPRILPANSRGTDDFHDSSLIDISINPSLNTITATLSTPDEHGFQRLWTVRFSGVLRFEYEIRGDGLEATDNPVEIYSIYSREEGAQWDRWRKRLQALGGGAIKDVKLFHVVLASSFASGWGDNEDLEGISVVCREVIVEPAPDEYVGREFSRPSIPAGPE